MSDLRQAVEQAVAAAIVKPIHVLRTVSVGSSLGDPMYEERQCACVPLGEWMALLRAAGWLGPSHDWNREADRG